MVGWENLLQASNISIVTRIECWQKMWTQLKAGGVAPRHSRGLVELACPVEEQAPAVDACALFIHDRCLGTLVPRQKAKAFLTTY